VISIIPSNTSTTDIATSGKNIFGSFGFELRDIKALV
jgi:hypothetical protein